MDTADSLSINFQGVTVAASGAFAIIAVLAAMMISGAVFLKGRKMGLW